ncbi:MAG TPA: aminoacyl-tRNA hydrolase [Alphaproteobacteria bacterium]|nr:aminoacyl-tRNA hydrolase [Alphaproteobacteria bacterium]
MQFTRLIVGLGNPGPEHAMNRHNIGFMAADVIAARQELSPWKRKFKGVVTSGTEAGVNFLLLKPETFMNNSGEAVGEVMRFHKLSPHEVIVFHDDLDLQPGQIKIKRGGGAGGHNGIKSCDAHIGPDYWRVRLGIGHPGRGAVAVATGACAPGAEQSRQNKKGEAVLNYVLGNFAKADHAWLGPLLGSLAAELGLLLKGRVAEYLGHVLREMDKPSFRNQ